MTDGYEDDLCRGTYTNKKRRGKIPYTNDQHSFNFNRMYDASNKDITLAVVVLKIGIQYLSRWLQRYHYNNRS